jgi:hypothetical protein
MEKPIVEIGFHAGLYPAKNQEVPLVYLDFTVDGAKTILCA